MRYGSRELVTRNTTLSFALTVAVTYTSVIVMLSALEDAVGAVERPVSALPNVLTAKYVWKLGVLVAAAAILYITVPSATAILLIGLSCAAGVYVIETPFIAASAPWAALAVLLFLSMSLAKAFMTFVRTRALYDRFVEKMATLLPPPKGRRQGLYAAFSATLGVSVGLLIAYMLTVNGILPVRQAELFLAGSLTCLVMLLVGGQARSRTRTLAAAMLGGVISWLALPISLLDVIYTPCLVSAGARRRHGVSLNVGRVIACLRYGKPFLDVRVSNDTAKKGLTWFWEQASPDECYIDLRDERNPHILITGASGSGKSTAVKNLVLSLASAGIGNIIVIDFHGEYSELLGQVKAVCGTKVSYIDARRYSVNPLELDGASPKERAVQLADTMQRLFNLGPLQRAQLERLLEELYSMHGIHDDEPSTWHLEPPDLRKLYAYIGELLAGSVASTDRSRLEALRQYVGLLLDDVFGRTSIPLAELLSGVVVLDLSKMPTDYMKVLYVETLLRKIAFQAYREGPSPTLRRYVVIDEAHILTSRRGTKESLVAKLLAETRKYGIGFIVATQQPKDVEDSVVANTSVKIALMIDEPSNLEYASKIISGYFHDNRLDVIRGTLHRLPVGVAIVKADAYREPVLVELPPPPAS